MMRAVVLRTLDGPEALTLDDWPDPEPGPDDVVVRVEAAGLNRRDVYVTRGLYPGVVVPSVPGSDGAGRVVAVGRDVRGTAVGDEVVINPGLHWGPDPRAQGAAFEILGVPHPGTFAEFVCVPSANVVPKPPAWSWAEAAAMPLAGVTAYRALFTRGGLGPGETVLIPGAGGGVATLLIQMAARAGARVAATSSTGAKREAAQRLGAAVVVDYTEREWVRQARAALNGPCDLAVDGVGGETFSDLLRLVRPGGRIVSYGATRGPVPNLVLPTLFLKQVDVRGTTMGSPDDFAAMMRWVAAHNVKPVIDAVVPWHQAVSALRRLEDGQQFGKLVLRMGEDSG